MEAEAASTQVIDILENITDGFFSLDNQWRFTYVNPATERLLCKTRAELLGFSIWEVSPELVGSVFDKQLRWAVKDQVAAHFTMPSVQGKLGGEVNAYPHPERLTIYWREWNTNLIDVNDCQRAEAEENLRLSENRYRTLANAVSQLMWVNDAHGNIEFFNQGWHEYTGVEHLKLGVGLWHEIIHPDDFQPTLEKRTQAIQAGVAYEVECRLKRYDQTYRWHLARIVPFKDESGQVLQWFGTATDIHDVKQIEAALRESERIAKARAEELETFMETVPAAVWIAHDAQCHYMSANRAAYQLVELPPGTVATATPEAEAYPFSFKIQNNGQDIPLHELPMQQAGRTNSEVEGEFNFVFDNGKIKSIWGRAVPLKNDRGKVRGVIGAFLDISERKRAEDELRERERRFITLFNGMEDWGLVYHLTPDNQPGQLIEVNEQACKKLGYSREELLTMSVTDIIGSPLVNPKASVEKLLKDKYVVVESVHTTKDGRRIPCEVSATLFTLNGLPTVQSICRDITERKQAEKALRESEERYRQIVETADEGIWIIDAEARTTFVNRKMAQMFGYTESEMMGCTLYDFMDEEEIAIAEYNFERRRQGVSEQHDFRFLRKDGSSIWTMLSTNPLFNDQGGFIGALAMVTDVTERKQAEQEREQLLARERVAREEAEAANRIKDEFLAVLSHELRSPLNPILGWAKLLQSRRFDEQATIRALETIERNAKLQAQLIEDLLDVSRILRGKLVLNVASVNLVTTIAAALETMQLAAQAKGIQIQTRLAPSVGQVRGDAGRLQQVMWNLLSNAIKFTPTGGRVEMYLERVGNSAQIQVKDNGKGIAPEFLPHVFEYFRQADGTTTRQFGGLGLGLAIARHLVELHGGTVQADSPGEELGATFSVTLPLLEEVRENSHKVEPASAANLHGVRILVVDDEADMRELMAFILEESGAEVQVAASAAEAFEKWDEFQPDLLISDIGMPNVDGYMLMRQVRKRAPEQGGKISAIALTAYAGESNEQQARLAGFQRHLSKPIEPHELVKAIATLMHR